jgi:nucleotide-binding universal stress UspA family protein
MISTILVPTDGSDTAHKAGAYAVALARQLQASILALSVIDKRLLAIRTVPVERSFPGVAESLDDFLRETAQRAVGDIETLSQEAGVPSKTKIVSGHPVEEIVQEAEKSKADLIVMGSHGQSALVAAALGSVTYGVIHKDTTIPVLVVRR